MKHIKHFYNFERTMWTQWNVKKRLCSSEIYDFMMRVRGKRYPAMIATTGRDFSLLFIAKIKDLVVGARFALCAHLEEVSLPRERKNRWRRSCDFNEPAVTSAFLMSQTTGRDSSSKPSVRKKQKLRKISITHNEEHGNARESSRCQKSSAQRPKMLCLRAY